MIVDTSTISTSKSSVNLVSQEMTELSLHCFNSESNYFFTALQYHFSTQELNRPNFVKMLAAKADKKRDNADVLAKFQLSRGYNVNVSDHSYFHHLAFY